MKTDRLLHDVRNGRPTRRQLLVGMATLGIVPTVLSLPRRVMAEPNLSVFTWADYNEAAYHQTFIDKHGGSPEFSFFGEEEEALQKMRGGFTADVAHPCTSSVRRWNDAGLLKPLDPSRIEHWDDVFPTFKTIRGVVIDGQPYHMPWDWGNESITYRTDLVEPADNSYSLLLDERYRKRMAMFDSVDSMVGVCGLIAGVNDPFDMTDDEIERTTAVMRQVHANLLFYWTDYTQVTQALASGELVAAWSWNDALVTLKQQGLPVEYMRPKEGRFTWVCGLSLLKDGPGSEEQAYDFLGAMLEPEAGKHLIETFGYGHANRKSLDLVDPAQLEELGIADVDAVLGSSHYFDEMPAATREKLVIIFDEVKAGL